MLGLADVGLPLNRMFCISHHHHHHVHAIRVAG
jgi:hypothetical protein